LRPGMHGLKTRPTNLGHRGFRGRLVTKPPIVAYLIEIKGLWTNP
jgi:hypothetical protein